MDVNYFGLLRLAQEFGPALRARGADGQSNAMAWVNLLSIYALANFPPHGTFSASKAAAHSLAQCLRAEMRPAGVRVINVFPGPIDDEWNQLLPPPKLAPAALANAVVAALRDGVEDVYPGRRRAGMARALARQSEGARDASWLDVSSAVNATDPRRAGRRAARRADPGHRPHPDAVAGLPADRRCRRRWASAWPFRIEEISRYDERGPGWYWNNFSCGEHTGTHFDAPIHWISGRDLPNNAIDTIPVEHFVGAGVA